MATWRELSSDNLRASKMLMREEQFRSSISRAYYSAYCAVMAELVGRGVAFAHGWHNPAHDQLLPLITHNLSLSEPNRRKLRKNLRFLREARENADYRPGATVGRSLALTCILAAAAVGEVLEVEQDE